MDEILKTKLFRLLSGSSQVMNEEIQTAYGEFMNQIKSVVQSEADFSEIFRTLNFTRIEFRVLQGEILCEQEKKRA